MKGFHDGCSSFVCITDNRRNRWSIIFWVLKRNALVLAPVSTLCKLYRKDRLGYDYYGRVRCGGVGWGTTED